MTKKKVTQADKVIKLFAKLQIEEYLITQVFKVLAKTPNLTQEDIITTINVTRKTKVCQSTISNVIREAVELDMLRKFPVGKYTTYRISAKYTEINEYVQKISTKFYIT